MGDDMGGFKYGGPLMGYRDGGWPPAQGSLLGKAGRGMAAGLPGLIAMLLMQATTGSDPISEVFWPEKLGDPNEAKYFEELDERAFRDKMDERHGIGWSPDLVQTPRINPGRRIDLSRVMRAGR